MRISVSIVLSVGLFASAAHAADLDVSVRNAQGKPVADAVVTVETADKKAPPSRFTQPLTVTQRQLQFEPFVLVVPVGAEVRFPNEDQVRHQVYSFSPAKTFELKLYGKDQSRSVKFDKPGVVSLGCNIHDQMVGFIKVVAQPYAVKTDASGHAVIHNLPAGAAVVRVWHPYLKAADNELKADVALPAAGEVKRDFAVSLHTPAMRMSGY